jgi:endonuclease/exonuclease/phosphatase family metal-dependent hydrolase
MAGVMGTRRYTLSMSGAFAGAALLALTPPSAETFGLSAREARPLPLAGPAVPVQRPVDFEVLTYNVHGLPAVLRKSGVAPLEAIGERLRELRESGVHPRIVVLQEAFTEEAKAIGRAGGYRYVVDGPARDATLSGAAATLAERQWWIGEGWGHYVDSGLQVLSDYPVVSVQRLPFPEGACAGFDCLANKGALIVSVRLPGAGGPTIDIATSHFNARGASGASRSRSLAAFAAQADALASALADRDHPERPLVLAGDFNVGRDRDRAAAMAGSLAALGQRCALRNAVDRVERDKMSALAEDVREARERNKDLQFWADGTGDSLRPVQVEAPFGREQDGSMLSDHIGFSVGYRLVSDSRSPAT